MLEQVLDSQRHQAQLKGDPAHAFRISQAAAQGVSPDAWAPRDIAPKSPALALNVTNRPDAVHVQVSGNHPCACAVQHRRSIDAAVQHVGTPGGWDVDIISPVTPGHSGCVGNPVAGCASLDVGSLNASGALCGCGVGGGLGACRSCCR